MAKKAKKEATIASESLTQLTTVLEQQAHGKLIVPAETGAKLMSHSTSDAVNVAVVMYEKVCKANLDAGRVQMREAEKALKEAKAALEKAVSGAVEKKVNDTLEQWKAAYTGSKLAFHKKFDITVREISDENEGRKKVADVRVTCELYSDSQKSHYGGSDSLQNNVTLRYEYSFAELAVVEKVSAVAELQTKVAELTQQLCDWRSRLSEMSSVERRARAAMTTAVMGNTEEGRTLLAGMVQAVLPGLMAGVTAFDPLALESALGQVVNSDA